MSIKDILIKLGYEEAGVLLEDDLLNATSSLLLPDNKTVGTAFKFVTLQKYNPAVVGGKFEPSDENYYATHFWKVYPESEEDEFEFEL